MSLTSRAIYIESDSTFELIGTSPRNFIVFSIKKTSYHTPYQKGKEDLFETFLLVRGNGESTPEKNIVFARQKKITGQVSGKISQHNYLSAQTFYSSFLRHVDLSYSRKLAQLSQILNINTGFQVQNQWLILYQVHNYKISTKSLMKLQPSTPQYGGKVIIHNVFQDNTFQIARNESIISNLFRLGSQNFYFLSDCNDSYQLKGMQLVVSRNEKQIYGLIYKLKQDFLCIPLNLILFDKPCETKIEASLFNKLYKTCYVQFFGSYCTGILISKNRVVTTRHLLPLHQQQTQIKVIIKKFPFKQNQYGVVIKIGLGNIDFMEIQILEKQNDKKLMNLQHKKQKTFVKQYLHNVDCSQNTCDGQQKLIEKRSFSSIRKFLDLKSSQMMGQKYQIGDNVVALGFGKFGYSSHIFNKFDIILPTIASGIVSKLIQINGTNIYLKTDAKLYSGFSGSGIWKQDCIGMAVFILKNRNTHSHYNRHNFSYTIDFLSHLVNSKQKQIKIHFNKQLQNFDKIQTRQFLNLIGHPKPKL